jgi:hypothetical protein
MKLRYAWLGAAAIAAACTAAAPAADRDRSSATNKVAGSTQARPPVPLDTHAMNMMLRADRDKDGTLSPQELEQYDLGLARRFRDADADGDGKLTLYEFEKLLEPAESTAQRDRTPSAPSAPSGGAVGATR